MNFSSASKTIRDYYDSALRISPAIEEAREAFRYRHLVTQLARRDILTRYKRSYLGVAWTMLNPLGTMLILSIVFYQAFGGGQKAYAAYILSGLISWNFFAQTTNAATVNLVWGGSLLRRIYVPRTVFALAATATGLLNLVLSLIPLILVMLLTGVPIRPSILLLPIPILFLTMFSLGIGLLISSIAIFFADVAEMYGIVLTAWFYLTPIIYPVSIIPERFLPIYLLNPMLYMIILVPYCDLLRSSTQPEPVPHLRWDRNRGFGYRLDILRPPCR